MTRTEVEQMTEEEFEKWWNAPKSEIIKQYAIENNIPILEFEMATIKQGEL